MLDEKSVLVIGAGITGATVAQRLSQAGMLVHLIEKEASIGGHVAEMGCKATDVCLRCNICVANELLRNLTNSDSIHIHTKTELITLADGANDTLDLNSGTDDAGNIVDAFGDQISFDILKALYIKNTSTDANLLVGGAAANQVLIFDNTSDILTIKPGGQFLNLETSQPKSKYLRKIFHVYIRKVVRPIGSFLSGSKAGYGYLAYTVPRFYPPEEFSALLLSHSTA